MGGRLSISAERTRKEMVNPQVKKAGWYLRGLSKVEIDIPMDMNESWFLPKAYKHG